MLVTLITKIIKVTRSFNCLLIGVSAHAHQPNGAGYRILIKASPKRVL